MGKTIDVAPGGKITSAWGNEIRDRSNQVFATEAERNSQWAASAAPVGATSVTTDTGLRWQKVGTAWVPAMGSVPAFATTAARDAAWPSPPNGALCVTTDTNTLWQRIGGVWVGDAWAFGGFATGNNVGAVNTSMTLAASINQRNITKSTASKLRVSFKGIYLVSWNMYCYQPNGNLAQEIVPQIFQWTGGTNVREVHLYSTMLVNNWWWAGALSHLFALSANDEIEFVMRTNNAGGFYMDQGSTFALHRVGTF